MQFAFWLIFDFPNRLKISKFIPVLNTKTLTHQKYLPTHSQGSSTDCKFSKILILEWRVQKIFVLCFKNHNEKLKGQIMPHCALALVNSRYKFPKILFRVKYKTYFSLCLKHTKKKKNVCQ